MLSDRLSSLSSAILSSESIEISVSAPFSFIFSVSSEILFSSFEVVKSISLSSFLISCASSLSFKEISKSLLWVSVMIVSKSVMFILFSWLSNFLLSSKKSPLFKSKSISFFASEPASESFIHSTFISELEEESDVRDEESHISPKSSTKSSHDWLVDAWVVQTGFVFSSGILFTLVYKSFTIIFKMSNKAKNRRLFLMKNCCSIFHWFFT